MTSYSCSPDNREEGEKKQQTDNPEGEKPDDGQTDPPYVDPDKGYTFKFNGVLAEAGHPRLLMTEDDFAVLKRKVGEEAAQNPLIKKVHDIIMDRANSLLASTYTFSYTLDAADLRLLQVFTPALDRMFNLTYAYKMTGDRKYLDKLNADIDNLTDPSIFPDWNAQRHFLDVAEASIAAVFPYDWLYNELTEERREALYRCLLKYSVEPGIDDGLAVFRKRTTNWNQVCYGGTVLAALACYDKNRADAANRACITLIENCVVDNALSQQTIYGPDGNYVEGYSYWSYGTDYQVLFLRALEKIFGHCGGLDSWPGFKKTGRFMLYMPGTAGYVFNYADSSYGECPLYAMWYFANKYKDSSYLYNELKYLQIPAWWGYAGNCRLLPEIPGLLLDMDVKEAEAPKERFWVGHGDAPVCLIRTGWTDNTKDQYLGIKGGQPKASHGHMDQGSFVYDALGVRWSEDLGNQDYAPLETTFAALGGKLWDYKMDSYRWKVFRLNNLSHSTLVINDALFAFKGFSDFISVTDRDGTVTATLDMSKTLADQAKSVFRTFMINDDGVTIKDIIVALPGKAANVQWRMMTSATPEVGTGKITLSLGGKTLEITASSSSADITPALTTWKAENPAGKESWDWDNPGKTVVGHTFTIPAGKSVTVTTFLKPVKD